MHTGPGIDFVIDVGTPITVGASPASHEAATRQAVAFLDRAIRRDPVVWDDALRFLRAES